MSIKHSAPLTISRRRILAMAGLSAGATLLAGRTAIADADALVPTSFNAAANPENTSLGLLNQIEAGVLNVGYAEAGPTDGAAVLLLHGWPYDIYSYVDVAPLLASAGYRVIVLYVRWLWHDAFSFK